MLTDLSRIEAEMRRKGPQLSAEKEAQKAAKRQKAQELKIRGRQKTQSRSRDRAIKSYGYECGGIGQVAAQLSNPNEWTTFRAHY